MNVRNIRKKVYFNEDDMKIVSERAAYFNIPEGRFIREMSVQGVMKVYDTKQVNSVLLAFHRIVNEIRQIMKVAQQEQSPYTSDIEKMLDRCGELEKVLYDYISELRPEEILKG